jgi:hypothetical protein
MTSSETASGGHFGGTSAACAHAAGFAALLRQIEPGFGADRLRGRLLAAVRPRGTPQPNNNFGYGEINAGAMKAQPTDSLLDYLSTEAGKLQAGGLQLSLSLRPGTYPVGYEAPLSITPSAPCYCQLYRRDALGRYSLEFSTDSHANRMWYVVALYMFAKAAELLDHRIASIVVMGGHPWKHAARCRRHAGVRKCRRRPEARDRCYNRPPWSADVISLPLSPPHRL